MFNLTTISKKELLSSSVDSFDIKNDNDRKIMVEILNYLKMLAIHLSEEEWKDFQAQTMQTQEWKELEWFQQTPIEELYPEGTEVSIGKLENIIKSSLL